MTQDRIRTNDTLEASWRDLRKQRPQTGGAATTPGATWPQLLKLLKIWESNGFFTVGSAVRPTMQQKDALRPRLLPDAGALRKQRESRPWKILLNTGNKSIWQHLNQHPHPSHPLLFHRSFSYSSRHQHLPPHYRHLPPSRTHNYLIITDTFGGSRCWGSSSFERIPAIWSYPVFSVFVNFLVTFLWPRLCSWRSIWQWTLTELGNWCRIRRRAATKARPKPALEPFRNLVNMGDSPVRRIQSSSWSSSNSTIKVPFKFSLTLFKLSSRSLLCCQPIKLRGLSPWAPWPWV